MERGLDIADINRTIDPLLKAAFLTMDDDFVGKLWVLKQIATKVKKDGYFDLGSFCLEKQLDYREVHDTIETRLPEDNLLIEQCEVIVSEKWVQLLRKHAEETGVIQVESFATSRSLSKKSALCLLRNFLQGVYIPSSETFFAKA